MVSERRGFAADLVVTWTGAAANVALMLVKLGVGIISGSVALVADGVHSLSDVATDLVVLGGLRIAQRPADEDHSYGHGKFETLAAAVVALALGGASVWLAREAVSDLAAGTQRVAGFWPLIVAAVSIGVKEALYRATSKVARTSGSPATAANAWHHRSDALSSVAVLIGAAAALAGWPAGDRIAALAVAGLVALAAVKILHGAVHDLTEGALSPAEQSRVRRAVEGVPGVRGWHALRTRRAGRGAFVDMHIEVDPHLTVSQAHEIASEAEQAVDKALGGRAHVVVHIEPREEERA